MKKQDSLFDRFKNELSKETITLLMLITIVFALSLFCLFGLNAFSTTVNAILIIGCVGMGVSLWLLRKRIKKNQMELMKQMEELGLNEKAFAVNLKHFFKYFFTFNVTDDPDPVNLISLGVTSFDFIFDHDLKTIQMGVNLERPGLVIGVQGKTIDALTAYLNKHSRGYKLTLSLHDTKIWD